MKVIQCQLDNTKRIKKLNLLNMRQMQKNKVVKTYCVCAVLDADSHTHLLGNWLSAAILSYNVDAELQFERLVELLVLAKRRLQPV